MHEDSAVDDVTVVSTEMLLPSIVRTVVPIILCSSFVTTFLPGVSEADLGVIVSALITVGYYVIVRFLEHYVSGSFSWLLGHPLTPSYFAYTEDKVASNVSAISTPKHVNE
jgi:hypothetical protein